MMPIHRVVYSKVRSVTEEKRVVSGRRLVNGDAVFDTVSLGWYVHFEGSHEKLFIDKEQPDDLKPGDRVKITIAKVGQDDTQS